jgi:hypothetical protein
MMFGFEIEGVPFMVYVSEHAKRRMRERNVQKYACFGSIVALGEELLDMTHGTEFCVMDKELGISVVCGLHARGLEVSIEIITVLDNDEFYVKEGTRAYRLGI